MSEVTKRLPPKIKFEITRADKETGKRVIVKKGEVSTSAQYFIVKGIKERWYQIDAKYVWSVKDPKGKKPDTLKLVYDLFYSEPLAENSMVAEFSQETENAMVNSYLDQLITVATVGSKFVIGEKEAILMIASAGLCVFFGLSMNSFLHLVPNTVVHWLSAAPQ